MLKVQIAPAYFKNSKISEGACTYPEILLGQSTPFCAIECLPTAICIPK